MSNKQPVGGHIFSPFSNPLKYEAPAFKGFIGVPRNSIHTPGWGQPYKDAQGNPITSGTLGGPGQAAMVYEEKGVWKLRRNKNAQRFGEISWRGPKKSNKPDAKRYVISYHGPTTRHFATDAFVYGADAKHRNVYMGGGLIGVAPGPVLGACLKSISNKLHLIVVCLSEQGEIALRRVAGGPVYSDNEQALAKLAQYASTEYKEGWVFAGVVSIDSEYHTPKTPWFFNESGTEAQCIRQKTKHGIANGETKEELAGDRFKIIVGDTVATIPLGNRPAYQFEEKGKLTDNGMWLSPPDDQGYPHKWHEYSLNVRATCEGEQIVAVDYDGDEEILVRAVVDVSYNMYQDYMHGEDGDLYEGIPLAEKPHYRNWIDNPEGSAYSNPLELGVDPTATVGNHMAECWWGGWAWTYLAFQKDGVEYRINLEIASSLSEAQYLELPPDPNDHSIFLRFYEMQYVRFLDVRAGGLICTRLEVFENWAKQGTIATSAHETYDTDFSDSSVETIMEGSKVQEKQHLTYHLRLNWHPDASPRATWLIVTGETRGPEIGWNTAPWSWTATSWIGGRPKNNDVVGYNGPLGNLPINCWFPEETPLYRNSWYGLEILYHDKNTETASFCQREDKTFILSGELPDPDTGEPTSFLVTEPEDIGAAIDGPVYFPIGEL